MKKKAFITGISGFTGQYLAKTLIQAGYEVCGTGHPTPSPWTVYECNLLEAATLSSIMAAVRPDVVVHLAGISFVAHENVGDLYQTNIVGTRNLLNALVTTGCHPSSVLLASSANIYGNTTVAVIDESLPPAPANDYSVSKLAMEYMAKLWFGRLPITIVRPFNYTGVGQHEKFVLPKIVSHFKRQAPVLELGNLAVERDFGDVRMVVDAYRRLLELPAAGGVFNVCSGQCYSLHQVLAMLGELTGFAPQITINPAWVRTDDVQRLVGSKARLEGAIGPLLDISLQQTLQWMLEP